MGLGGAIANMMALLSLDNAEFLDGVDETLKSTDSFVSKLSDVGGGILVGGLSAAGAAIGAIGVATWEAGNTMDAAMDSIVVATGAAGPVLDGMRADFETVFTSIPTDAKKAAEVIGELNTRLGVTGGALTDLSIPMLEASRLLGGDATTNAKLFSRVLGDWDIPVEEGTFLLDKLFVAGQATGVGMDSLMSKVVQFGSPMRLMGFELDDAIALFSKWEKEGVNAELVMGSLRIAAGEFAREGVDLADGLWDTVDAIQNASSESDALAIAMDVFGARAGPDMAAAILEGRFEVEDLIGTLQNAEGAIMDTAESTASWGESWQKFLNKVTVRLAPLGAQMMDTAGQIVDSIGEIFDRPEVQAGITQFAGFASQLISTFATYIPVAIDYLFQFVSFLQENQGVVVAILAAMGVAVAAFVYTTVIPAALAAIGAMLPIILVMAAVAAVAYLVYEAWTNNWGGIRDTLTGVWTSLQPTFEALKQWLGVAIPAALKILSDLWNNALLPAIRAVWGFLSQNILPLWSAWAEMTRAVLGKSLTALAGIWQNVLWPAMKAGHEWFMANLYPGLKSFGQFLGGNFVTAIQAVSNVIQGLIGWIQRFTEKINSVSLPWWMTPGSPTPWELGLVGVQDTLDSLSRTSLPRFEAAVALQPVSLGAGSVDIQPRAVAVDTGSNTGRVSSGRDDDDLLMRELLRTLRNLPDDIRKAVRDEVLKRSG